MQFYATICQNGHLQIKSSLGSKDMYCEKCGGKILTRCPACNTPIREWQEDDDVLFIGYPSMDKPLYCRECGKPYPWTQSAIEATVLMIHEDEELSELERKNLESSLPDLISETPKTKVATIRVKKALLTAGTFTAEALRQFVIDFGCELAIRSLGLDQSK